MQVVYVLLMLGQLFSSEPAFGNQAYGIACCDINRDGYYDVLTASDIGINYYQSLSDNGFDDPLLYPADDARAVLGGDVNSDGWIDMFVATLGRDICFFNSGDDENFDTTSVYFPDEPTYAAALTDFDLDGDPDIFTAGAKSRIYVNYIDSFVVLDSFPAGFAVAWGDYNSDNWPDFALAGADSVYFYYYGNLTGEFIADTAIGLNNPRGVCWFDREGDGDLELAVADSAGLNIIIDPSLTFGLDTVGAETEPSVAVTAGNFDGQGGIDLIFINYGVEDRIYRGPDFTSDQSDTVSFGTMQSLGIAAADLDDVNGLDMAMARNGGNALYRSQVTSDFRIVISLQGRGDMVDGLSNTIASGAKVSVYNPVSMEGFAEISAHSGQNAPQVSFDIPEVEGYSVKMFWPRSQIIDSLALDTFQFPIEILAFEDITSPEPPSDLSIVSEHQDTTRWWNEDDVSFSWTLGADPRGSGVKGYSVRWSTDSMITPDTTVEAGSEDASGTFKADVEGELCYFFIATVDRVGNTSETARSPALKLDFTSPDSAELVFPVNAYLNDPLVRYQWTGGFDQTAGIRSYTLEVSSRPDFLTLIESVTGITDTFYQSLVSLEEDIYFWRLTVLDSAGNSATIPSQTEDTLGAWFVMDLTRPDTTQVTPRDGSADVVQNSNITVTFNEPVLASTALDENNYSITYGPQQDTIDFTAILQEDGFTVVLDPQSLLPSNSEVYVKMYNDITDLAGNSLRRSIYAWDFTTGDALDLQPPRIDSVAITPNPTGGATQVELLVVADDSASSWSGPNYCIYHVGDTLSPSITMRGVSEPYPWEKIFADTLHTDTLTHDTTYTLFFKVKDKADNWSDWEQAALSISDDTDPPQLEVLPADTILQVGDTLVLRITSSEPLQELWLEFNQTEPGPQDTFSRQDSVPLSADSVNFTARIPVTGFPPGAIAGTASGLDRASNRGNQPFSMTVEPGSLIEDAFAAPNPARDQTGIYLTPGEDVTAELTVYTIDGQEVWRPEPVEVPGGERYMFAADVSEWPVGLYLFLARVEHADGRKAVVRKTFAVVR